MEESNTSMWKIIDSLSIYLSLFPLSRSVSSVSFSLPLFSPPSPPSISFSPPPPLIYLTIHPQIHPAIYPSLLTMKENIYTSKSRLEIPQRQANVNKTTKYLLDLTACARSNFYTVPWWVLHWPGS